MTYWNHYIVTEERRVDLSDIAVALKAANSQFQLDDNLVWLSDVEHGELAYAEVTFDDFTGETGLEDREFFGAHMQGKRNEAHLLTALENAKSLVNIQMYNIHIWGDREYAETLAPLQDWLLNNREGVLYVEGGEFYDRNGLLD